MCNVFFAIIMSELTSQQGAFQLQFPKNKREETRRKEQTKIILHKCTLVHRFALAITFSVHTILLSIRTRSFLSSLTTKVLVFLQNKFILLLAEFLFEKLLETYSYITCIQLLLNKKFRIQTSMDFLL